MNRTCAGLCNEIITGNILVATKSISNEASVLEENTTSIKSSNKEQKTNKSKNERKRDVRSHNFWSLTSQSRLSLNVTEKTKIKEIDLNN